MVNDNLGSRMKEFYETVPKTRLMRRTPVAIRLDGKAFHTFTKGFDRPFDRIFSDSMIATMKYLCENIQGCVFGYTQSDEITLILIDYQTFETDAWFDYEIQKMCSVSASMATMVFNSYFEDASYEFYDEHIVDPDEFDAIPGFGNFFDSQKNLDIYMAYVKSITRGAMFDSRVFNIPKEEVCNLVYWRQLDCTRNSIQAVGQAYFSHNELMNKSCNMIQDILHEEKGINWNDFAVRWKRGVACKKIVEQDPDVDIKDGFFPKSVWRVDYDMPILKGADRSYVNDCILYKEA